MTDQLTDDALEALVTGDLDDVALVTLATKMMALVTLARREWL